MHFSVDLILHVIPESFSSLLNDWAETIQNELMPGSLALDTDVELDEHEAARSLCVESSLNAARETLKCHLQSVLRAYLEALEQEAPRLWELSSKSPEAIRRFKIPRDSALQNFWPNDPTFDLGNLRSMLANSLPDDVMPDGGNRSTLLHLDAPINEGATSALYDVVSSTEPVTYEDAYEWAERVSLGQIPPLAPGTVDTAVEYAQMLAAEGNDPDFFLGELPPALSQIVRARLKAR
jgi:hypothetical protein